MKESFKSLGALSNFSSYVSVIKLLRTSELAVLYLGWEERCFEIISIIHGFFFLEIKPRVCWDNPLFIMPPEIEKGLWRRIARWMYHFPWQYYNVLAYFIFLPELYAVK